MPAVTVEHLQALCASLRPDAPAVAAVDPAVEPPLPFETAEVLS